MIVLIAAWALLLACSLSAGAAVVSLTRWPESFTRAEDRFIAAAWAGLLAWGSVLLAIACVMPLSPWLIPLPLVSLVSRPVRLRLREALPPPARWLSLAAFAVAVAALESGQERTYDSAVYHHQQIRWMADFGIVPGLGLLHERLAFSSSWLALAAPFDQGPFTHHMGRSATGLAMLLMLFQLAVALERAGKRDAQPRDWFSVFALPVFFVGSVLQVLNVSPSPNFGAAAALVICGWLLVDGPSALALAISGAACAIKVTAAPAMLGAMTKTRWPVLLLAGLLALPIVAANMRAAGCPVYPLPLLCLESPDSVGESAARQMSALIRKWGRAGLNDYSGPAWDVSWVPVWLAIPWNKPFLLVGVLSLAIVAALRAWNRAATLAVLVLFVFLIGSPDFRFGYGAVAVLAGCAGAAISQGRAAPPAARFSLPIPNASPFVWTVAGALFVLGGLGLQQVLAGWQEPNAPPAWDMRRLLMPAAAYRPAGVAPRRWQQNVWINLFAADDRCGTTPIPCAPGYSSADARLCDPARGLRGGFCRGPK